MALPVSDSCCAASRLSAKYTPSILRFSSDFRGPLERVRSRTLIYSVVVFTSVVKFRNGGNLFESIVSPESNATRLL